MSDEPDLLTLMEKQIEETKKLREAVEETNIILNDTANTMIQLTADTLYEIYLIADKTVKILQWYAETQTGRKYA